MEYLPPTDERDWLLQRLAELVETQGVGPLVAAPLLAANENTFPEAWTLTERGLQTLLQRLLLYAGLGHLQARVTTYANEVETLAFNQLGGPSSWRRVGAAAWFEDIDGDECLFGFDEHELKEPDKLVGIAAHEVAHAYRRYHALESEDHATEEKLTDLTTVYLGFGVPTTNNADRYRVQHESLGPFSSVVWDQSRTGYLSAQALSFLLAAAVVARESTSTVERARVVKLLEANQQSYFRAACRTIKADGLVARLRLPDPTTWPVAEHIAPTAEQISVLNQQAQVDREAAAAAPPPPRNLFNRGRPVFRVLHNASRRWAMVGYLLGVPVAALLNVFGEPVAIYAVCMVTGALLGFGLGRNQRRDFCCDTSCEASLSPEDKHCRRCGGTVSGTIHHVSERLAAADALERENGARDASDEEPEWRVPPTPPTGE